MIIVKIGGGDSINVEGVIRNLVHVNEPFIIVHGANACRDDLAHHLGREKRILTSVSGYSSVFSDENAIDLIMMAYSGLKNKRIVEICQQNGINAVGLSGLDGRTVIGRRNRGIRINENGKLKILRDFSGKPTSVNSALLHMLIEGGYVPVLCIPIIDENNFAINSENDDVVRVLHDAMNADMILSLIEAPGFLEDPNDEQSVITSMSREELEMREQNVEGRMKRKILALRKLFEKNPTRVVIADGRVENPVRDALDGIGTVIQ